MAFTDFVLVSLHFYHLFSRLFFQLCFLHKQLDTWIKTKEISREELVITCKGSGQNYSRKQELFPFKYFFYRHSSFLDANSVLWTEKLGNIRHQKFQTDPVLNLLWFS